MIARIQSLRIQARGLGIEDGEVFQIMFGAASVLGVWIGFAGLGSQL